VRQAREGQGAATFEKAWFEVLQEQSAKDPILQEVADHYVDFRKTYAIWGTAQEKAGHLD
jgi:TRAP-type mannitol/chloroaromatic compound transport system substrate-binding protein